MLGMLTDILLMDKILHFQVEVGSFSHYLSLFTGFCTSQVVVWDFFHQQYHLVTLTLRQLFVELARDHSDDPTCKNGALRGKMGG